MITFVRNCHQICNRTIIIFSCTFNFSILCRNRYCIFVYFKFGSQSCIRQNHYTSLSLCNSVGPFYKVITNRCNCINCSSRTMIILTSSFSYTIYRLQFNFIYIYCKFGSKLHIIKYFKLTLCYCITIGPTHKMIPVIRYSFYFNLFTMLILSFALNRSMFSTQFNCMYVSQENCC